jgi:hypothetical protein
MSYSVRKKQKEERNMEGDVWDFDQRHLDNFIPRYTFSHFVEVQGPHFRA